MVVGGGIRSHVLREVARREPANVCHDANGLQDCFHFARVKFVFVRIALEPKEQTRLLVHGEDEGVVLELELRRQLPFDPRILFVFLFPEPNQIGLCS